MKRNIITIGEHSLLKFPEPKKYIQTYIDEIDETFLIENKTDMSLIQNYRRTLPPITNNNKQGRNTKCNCGSGLKFKKCCISKP